MNANTDRKNVNSPAAKPVAANGTPPAPAVAAAVVTAPVEAGAVQPTGTPSSAPIPSTNGTPPTPDVDAPEPEDDKDPLMYFVVTGQAPAFKTISKTEAFLNGPNAPSEYVVIRGRAAPAKKRVSLRG